MNDCLVAWSREHEEEAWDPYLKGQELVFFAKCQDGVRKVSLDTEEAIELLSRNFYRQRLKTMAVGRWFCGCELITAESYDMLYKMISIAVAAEREAYEFIGKMADEATALQTTE